MEQERYFVPAVSPEQRLAVESESKIEAAQGAAERHASEGVEMVLAAGGTPEQVADARLAGEELIAKTNRAIAEVQREMKTREAAAAFTGREFEPEAGAEPVRTESAQAAEPEVALETSSEEEPSVPEEEGFSDGLAEALAGRAEVLEKLAAQFGGYSLAEQSGLLATADDLADRNPGDRSAPRKKSGTESELEGRIRAALEQMKEVHQTTSTQFLNTIEETGVSRETYGTRVAEQGLTVGALLDETHRNAGGLEGLTLLVASFRPSTEEQSTPVDEFLRSHYPGDRRRARVSPSSFGVVE